MKAFPGKRRLSAAERGPAQLSFSAGRRLAFLAAVVIASSTFVLAQAGQLDSTFGTGGIFATSFTQSGSTMDIAVAIQSDGKIVLGGSTPNGAALLRLNTNGTLDTSFGSGGIFESRLRRARTGYGPRHTAQPTNSGICGRIRYSIGWPIQP